MAKKLTDGTKWNKPFIRSLQAPYKLLWIYILDECDHAGIWQVDFEVAKLKIGEKLDLEKAVKFFEGKISIIDNGQKWFIIDYIEFQYGELDPLNRVHKSAIKILNRYNLLDENLKIMTLNTPYGGDIYTNKDKDKDKDIFGKCENLFFGDVPEDLVELSETLHPTEKAGEWHNYVQRKIEELGYATRREVPCPITEDRNGRLDLVASKDGVSIAIELDYRTPRRKSILKVKNYHCGMVLLRDPKIVRKPDGLYRSFHHLKLTVAEFESLEQKYSKEQIDKTLDAIQNYRKNINYTSLFLTASKWLEKDAKDNPNESKMQKVLNINQKLKNEAREQHT